MPGCSSRQGPQAPEDDRPRSGAPRRPGRGGAWCRWWPGPTHRPPGCRRRCRRARRRARRRATPPRPVTPGQRHAAGDALGRGHQVGDDALVLAGEPVPGPAEPGLDLVGHEQGAVRRAPPAQCREEARARGRRSPPSPWIGSTSTQATFAAPTWVSTSSSARRAASSPVMPAGSRNGYDIGHPVDLAGEGPEPVLVGHRLGRQRHGQVGAPVIRVVEDDDGLAPRGVAGHLDGVLDRLGPGVEQRALLVVVARGQRVELLAHGHVPLVGRDHEAGVGEPADLIAHGLDHRRLRVAHARRRRSPTRGR